MAWYDFFKGDITINLGNKSSEKTLETTNYHGGYRRENWYPVITEHFDGEKTPGEMGVLRNLLPNHRALRLRAYEAELKSDIVKIITGKFFKWVIGNGLKLQAQPNREVLKSEGIEISNVSDFRNIVEARFSVFSGSRFSDYQGMDDLHIRAQDAFNTAFLGGDCLCVLRLDELGNLNMQVIDGEHVKTPSIFSDSTSMLKEAKNRGNTVNHGIEKSPTGQHVAFFVLSESKDSILGKFKRIEARGPKTGRLMAWMVYGSKHRIDHDRGIPAITAILEKIEKLDRYTEAAVGSAEERAKIVFAIEHTKDSDGENPLLGKARQATAMRNNAAKETTGYDLGEKTAALIGATTSKQTFNLPIGASLKALSSMTEMQFEKFSKAVFYFLCAAVEIPPEVALQQYEQNYSSSRAAINAWDYIVKIYRQKFAKKFYQPFYNLWLELEVIKNKVDAKGFISALRSDNFMITEAYSSARFTGANMPHIDPLKEVKAIREMLGGDEAPLITREMASELLGTGDWEKIMQKFIEESKEVPKEEIPKQDESNSSQNRQQNNAVEPK